MRKFVPTIAFILFCSAAIFAQNVKPTPTPKPAADNDVVKISEKRFYAKDFG